MEGPAAPNNEVAPQRESNRLNDLQLPASSLANNEIDKDEDPHAAITNAYE